MKKLLIIRHAKASHDSDYEDFDRPLKKSGIKDAEQLAKKLETEGLIPQKMFTSPALRAKTTAEIVAKHLDLPELGFIDEVYEASESALLKMINQFPNQYDFVALSGHNPGLSYIITYLTGDYCNLDTCAAALLIFDTDIWNAISADTGKISWFNEPN
ncbi:SixA phosphatase family protein [Mucilaginibacter agri]|uniref:Histidine phosphatase family protein n=1 Tax=Mucilaginibacter agri TaxID=2695265 RepID=A0A965ZGN9_9SPHI|nr:histidine phosphatase family protein [Mucilaginibacter agri]NCD69823.1 histidine phosphatase family protein [Mucilaginibacter agri]